MRHGTDYQGYTIIEVMIFLAVSGVMFVLAAFFINGKQASAQFVQGVNSFNSQVQQMISDVSDGNYPTGVRFSCIKPTSPSSQPSFSTSTSNQGQNVGCVFVGKILQIGGNGKLANIDSEYVVAGCQFSPCNTTNVSSLSNDSDAYPVVVPATYNLTQTAQLPWGIYVTQMTESTSSPPSINAIGFFSSSNGAAASGSQTLVVETFSSSQPLDQLNPTISYINNIFKSTNSGAITPDTTPVDIVICLQGGAGEYGTLTIGDSSDTGQQLSTDTQISSSPIGSCPK